MNSEDVNYLLTCVFTAIFGVFGIYHLASFLILRHKILFYYCILILSLTLHWSWYLLALGPLNDAIADKASVVSAMAATYGLLLFTKNYLNIEKNKHPKLSKSYTLLKRTVVCVPILYVLNILTFKIAWLNNSLVMLAAISAMVSVFLNIFSGVRLYKEEKFNKFYLYSYTPLLLAAIIYIGTWFVQKQYTVDTLLVLVTTSSLITLQLMLFSILVGYKFKSIEDENIRTQVETNKILTTEVDRQTKKLQIAKTALEQQNRELETVNGLKNKLFSLLTHDVRAPLNNITVLVEMIEAQVADTTLKEITKKLKNKVDDRISMVNALLEWSYNQLEGITLNKKNCDVKTIFESVAKEFERMAADKNVQLVFDISSPTLFVDENMFKVMLRNLTSNAIKFSNEGQKVILSSKNDSEIIEIGVQDFGVGMNTDWYKNLENDGIPNVALGTSGELGTGFGLLITKDFVEMNGGKMICISERNQGTQFILRFSSLG